MSEAQKSHFSYYDRSLGRTLKTNLPFYSCDGFGRDTYIGFNNGGIWKENISKVKLKPEYEIPKYSSFHSLRHAPAPKKYFSDGSGRDSYVVYDEGGLVNLFLPSLVYNKNCLFRNYVSPLATTRVKNTTFSKAEIERNRYLKQVRNDIVDRLYTKAKKKILQKNFHLSRNDPILNNRNSRELVKENPLLRSQDRRELMLPRENAIFRSASCGNLVVHPNKTFRSKRKFEDLDNVY